MPDTIRDKARGMGKDVPSGRFWRRGGGSPELNSTERHAAALSMLVARRALRGTLPAGFIHDPALEMLLALYLAQPAPVASDELAATTTVSRTVATHWIEALRAEGLVALSGEAASLTVDGGQAMEGMIEAVVTSQRDLLGWGEQ